MLATKFFVSLFLNNGLFFLVIEMIVELFYHGVSFC